jgi:hypothetical protein
MGFLDSLITIAGIGLIGYIGYVTLGPTVIQRMFGGSYTPQQQQVAAPAALPPLPPEPAAQQKQKPATEPPKSSSTGTNLVPSKSDMTSPNVAGTAFTFNVVGDVDETPATATNLCGSSPTLAIFVGDFAYHNDAQKWWTGSMKACNGKNVIGSLGNHDNGGKGFIDLWPANGGKWEFIKKIGNVAVIAVNTGSCSATCANPSSVEPLFQQAQADPSVKFIVAHHHKSIFTTGISPDASPAYHTMYKKYPKVKMVFAGHNHYYARYKPLDGIQYITVGTGGHDLSSSTSGSTGPSSKTIGVAKCRVSTDGGITCQFVSNSGQILDQWGLTGAGKHTGTGGLTPKNGPTVAESGLAITQAYYSSYLSQPQSTPEAEEKKEERDEFFNKLIQRRYHKMFPQRKFNNKIYHYSARRRRYY